MRIKRIIFRTLLVIVAIIAGLTLWVYFWWNEKPVISVDYVAKFNEMRKPADYRPEDDGADLYLKACSMGVAYDCPERLIFPPRWPGDMNDVEIGLVKAWVASNEPAIAILEQAMTKPQFWLKRDSDNGSIYGIRYTELNGLKNLTRALVCRGKLKAWQGDVTGGLADIFTAGDIGKCFGDKPDALEWMVGIALANMGRAACLDLTSHTEVPSSQLDMSASNIEAMAAHWESMDSVFDQQRLAFLDDVQRSFGPSGRLLPKPLYDEERAACSTLRPGQFFHGYLSRLTPELWGGVTPSHLSRWRTVKKALAFAWHVGRKDVTVKWYGKGVESLRGLLGTDEGQRLAFTGDLRAQVGFRPGEYSFVAPYNQTILNMARHRYRFQSDCAATIGIIAILRYRAEKQALPDGWQELVGGGYLKEVPIDRYSGNSFIYRKTAEGFTVYSVGENGVDDGGDRKKDIVFWPVEKVERSTAKPLGDPNK